VYAVVIAVVVALASFSIPPVLRFTLNSFGKIERSYEGPSFLPLVTVTADLIKFRVR